MHRAGDVYTIYMEDGTPVTFGQLYMLSQVGPYEFALISLAAESNRFTEAVRCKDSTVVTEDELNLLLKGKLLKGKRARKVGRMPKRFTLEDLE